MPAKFADRFLRISAKPELDPIEDIAEKFEILFRGTNGFSEAVPQFVFPFVPFLALDQPLVKHDALFEFANGRPKRALQRFGMFFTQALGRVGVTDKALVARELAFLLFVKRAVAFRARNRDLLARWFLCRMIGRGMFFHF